MYQLQNHKRSQLQEPNLLLHPKNQLLQVNQHQKNQLQKSQHQKSQHHLSHSQLPQLHQLSHWKLSEVKLLVMMTKMMVSQLMWTQLRFQEANNKSQKKWLKTLKLPTTPELKWLRPKKPWLMSSKLSKNHWKNSLNRSRMLERRWKNLKLKSKLKTLN